MKLGLILLAVTLAVPALRADSTACCFSDTFKMDGTFDLLLNATRPGRSEIFFIVKAKGRLSSTADFVNKKFTATFTLDASAQDERRNRSMQAAATMILDASRSEPLAYGRGSTYFSGRPNGRRERGWEDRCMYRPVGRIDLLAGYQCVTQYVLQSGDVSDGRIKMRLKQEFPDRVADNLEIYFDQRTCTPSLITYNHRPTSEVYVSFTFKADSSTSVKSVPDIPDDLSECRAGSSVDVGPADDTDDFLSLAFMMAGVRG